MSPNDSPSHNVEVQDMERYDLRCLGESQLFELERLLLQPGLAPASRAQRDDLLLQAEQPHG